MKLKDEYRFVKQLHMKPQGGFGCLFSYPNSHICCIKTRILS